MEIKERAYSVLIVSTSEKLNTALQDLLPGASWSTVCLVSDLGAAARKWAERHFDMVIINSPLPDGTGARFAMNLCTSGNAVVLLMLKAEIYDELYEELVGHGVFSLKKPTPLPVLSAALGFMSAARERLRGSEEKALSIEEKMKEIRLVNRAKWLLIEREALSEPQAHRSIEKSAMDRCVPKRQVAEEIIEKYKAV